MAPTITVKGEGGFVFDMDVPEDGTVRREVFDQAIEKGRLKVLSGDWPPADETPVEDKPKRGRSKKADETPVEDHSVEDNSAEDPDVDGGER